MDQIPLLERQLNALKSYYGVKTDSYTTIYHGLTIGMIIISIMLILISYLRGTQTHPPIQPTVPAVSGATAPHYQQPYLTAMEHYPMLPNWKLLC